MYRAKKKGLEKDIVNRCRTHPRVTVLMSVYNGEQYLADAIDSILLQSSSDFEFLIIDDGSTDKTQAILRNIKDPRVKVIRNSRNIGLTKSLNLGLTYAKGEYIARQDADDISYSTRLEEQLDFMDANPDVAVVGTAYKENFVELHQVRSIFLPEENSLIIDSLVYHYGIAHATVMMRKSMLESVCGYDETFEVAQDRVLWLKMAEKYKLSNIPKVLYEVMIRSSSISSRRRQEQLIMTNKACSEALDRNHIKFSDQAKARFLWLKALLAIELHQNKAAVESLKDLSFNPDISAEEINWFGSVAASRAIAIERETGTLGNGPGVAFIETLFKLLPASMSIVAGKRNWIEGEFYAACAFDASALGNAMLVRKNALRAWRNHNLYRNNIGLYSIFLRSVFPHRS